MKKRHGEEQIIYTLKRLEIGSKGLEVCREMGISEQTLCNWKRKYGGMLANLPPAAFANEFREKKRTENRELLVVGNSI